MIKVFFDPDNSDGLVLEVDPPAPHHEGDPVVASDLLFAILAPPASEETDQSTQPSPESR